MVPLSTAPWVVTASLKDSAAGDEHAAGSAFDQLSAHAALQGGDGLGQAGLADAKSRGRLTEVLVVAQGDEGSQLREGGKRSSHSLS